MTPVDAVIFAQLAYFDFAKLRLPEHTPLEVITETQAEAITHSTWAAADNAALLTALAHSPRFRNVKWANGYTKNDPALESQFSAITLQMQPDEFFIAYRGTRATFVDWKEDVNMTFMDRVPAQQEALRYFTRQAAAQPGKYGLGGHSKGGNLAAYVVIHANTAARAQIMRAYNVDGPGFRHGIPASRQQKITKLVPQSSVIGMLLDPGQDFKVVQSGAHGFRQHDPFSWHVTGQDFVYLPETTWASQFTQRTVATWLASLDDETKQASLDAAFALIEATDAETFREFGSHLPQNAQQVLKGLRHVEPPVQQQWRTVAIQLLKAMLGSMNWPPAPLDLKDKVAQHLPLHWPPLPRK